MTSPRHSNRNDNVVNGRFGARAPDSEEPEDTVAEGTARPATAVEPVLSEELREALVGFGYRPRASRRAVLTDAFCDTAAFDIMRAGFALRLRGSQAGIHVTLRSLDRPGYDDLDVQRSEIGGPVASGSDPFRPAGWPEPVRDRVRTLAGDSPRLMALCVLHERRETIPLARDDEEDGPEVAALALNVVSLFDPSDADGGGSSPQGIARLLEDGTPVETFAELDVVSVAEGEQDSLRDLTKDLRTIADASPIADCRLERALGDLADHTPGQPEGRLGIDPGMSMTEAGRLMWRRQLLAMILTEAGARRGRDIEYVHDMRVATRRARAVARLFGPFFRRKVLRAHLAGLKRTARALGAVRDADVALFKLERYSRDRPEEEQPGLAEIRAVWRVQRRQAYRSLLEWLDGPAYRHFVTEFSELCRTPGLGDRPFGSETGVGPEPRRVADVMPSAILGRFEKIRAYEPLFDSTQPVPLEALHALRIDCKALRYGLEPVKHRMGEEGGKIVRRLKRLQDLLGDLNDAAVADANLSELVDIVDAAALATYRSHQQTVMAELAEAAPAAWRAFVAPENRRRLASAIARL